ncbi:MAG: hypothetical protein K6E33_03390 [Lachnospiraceae bacterium]|nr:hypothetical protein [Lachnospiraceae bacterium]
MAVFLAVLKTIGIVLLLIIAVILIILLLVLFFPVFYKLSAVRTENEGDPPVDARLNANWLFGFVRATGVWNGSLDVKVKVLCFTVFRIPGPDDNENPEDGYITDEDLQMALEETGDAGDIGETVASDDLSSAEDSDGAGEEVSDQGPGDETSEQSGGDEAENSEGPQDSAPDEDEITDEPEEENKIFKFFEYLSRLPDIVRKVFCTLKKACDNIIKAPEYINYYLMLLQAERTGRAFEKAVRRGGKIITEILPRNWKADLTVGTGDPDSTGLITEIYSMAYPFVAGHTDYTADYDNSTFLLDLSAKGHIMIVVLLYQGFLLYIDKDIKKTIKRFRREKE